MESKEKMNAKVSRGFEKNEYHQLVGKGFNREKW